MTEEVTSSTTGGALHRLCGCIRAGGTAKPPLIMPRKSLDNCHDNSPEGTSAHSKLLTSGEAWPPPTSKPTTPQCLMFGYGPLHVPPLGSAQSHDSLFGQDVQGERVDPL